VAQEVWQRHPGVWEVTVIPENQRALQFWRKAITATVNHNFVEEIKIKEGRDDPDQPNRIFLTFNTSFKKNLISSQSVKIRTATLEDAESIAKIHVKAWQESYKGIISQAYLDEIPFQDRLNLRKKILSEHNPDSIHLVATINDQIVGFCDAGSAFTKSNLFHGEIYAIYLLNEYKHSGIGSTLITSAHTHLAQRKLLPYVAWVLKENISACRFYEKHGGYKFDEELIDIGDRSYPEVAYIFGLQISIRTAKTTDIKTMVALSHQKRLAYEKDVGHQHNTTAPFQI
jgi:predicted acetyltransferase